MLATLLAGLLGLSAGGHWLQPAGIWSVLSGQADDGLAQIVWQLRWPRLLTAFVAGGLLGLSGTLMQVLLRNPLADPYVLGVSGGAAVAALSGMLLGVGALWIAPMAFAGALASVLLVFGLARLGRDWDTQRLLLTGVVLAAGWGALTNLLLILSDRHSVHNMLFWLMGDLSLARYQHSAGLMLLLGLAVSWARARDLNLLLRGELTAASLGSPVNAIRWLIFLLAAGCTASAVAIAGSVGFVGLIVPHLMRQLLGSDHRWLLPAATLAGGLLLMLADTGARTLLAPLQLPVGVITALIGVPAFLYLLQRSRRGSA